jgi:uncharacterized small protein (DUF1192 family)
MAVVGPAITFDDALQILRVRHAQEVAELQSRIAVLEMWKRRRSNDSFGYLINAADNLQALVERMKDTLVHIALESEVDAPMLQGWARGLLIEEFPEDFSSVPTAEDEVERLRAELAKRDRDIAVRDEQDHDEKDAVQRVVGQQESELRGKEIEIERLRRDVSELHRPSRMQPEHCVTCRVAWPCPTDRVINPTLA